LISSVRRVAQTLRHAPVLRSFTPMWTLLRAPYLGFMNRFGSASGISVTIGGTKIRLHPDFATQNWETVEYDSYRAFRELLRPGAVVYDVGAHIGTYTLIAAERVGLAGRVVAYEPHASTRRYLEQHLAWNGGTANTVIRDICLGASAGRATFYCVPDRAEGRNGLVPIDGFQQQAVQVTTLDLEVEALGLAPSVLKIDVEGAEWDVLRGAQQTLRNFHPRISLSLHPQALTKKGERPEDVLAWLGTLGYEARIVGRDHEIHVVAQKR